MKSNSTSRKDFLKTVGLGALTLPVYGNLSAKPANVKKPNVIIIYVDDATFTHFGCYGGPSATPNIDSLAHRGVKFTRYYTSSAVCTPSRYGAITGRIATRSTDIQREFSAGTPVQLTWNASIGEGEKTLPGVLRDNGYKTGIVGKWHLNPMEKVDTKSREEIDPNTAEGKAILEAQYDSDCRHIRERGGFDYADGIYSGNINALPIPKELRYHNVEWQTSKAMEFIDRSKDDPFFLYWATPIIHSPNPLLSIQADPRITPKGYLKEAPKTRSSRKELIDRLYTYGIIDPREDGKGWWESSYGAAGMAWLDEGIGTLLDYLDQKGIADNTMIILASDNGYQRGKNTCYESGTNVPCIVYWPGKTKAGATCDELACNLDFAPSIFEACGASVPDDYVLDGKSFLPVLANPGAQIHDSLFFEVGYSRAVVTKDWKYLAVRFPEETEAIVNSSNYKEFSHDGTRDVDHRFGAHVYYPGYFDKDQLYNIDADPVEQYNLAGKTNYSVQLDQMKGLLSKYCRSLPHSFGEFTSNN
ncbi:MAG: sulfatase-like hydrolase/transferase [Gemmatimonadota bacterium]|nr:sulfatase-like hydrolase/transferase [Gemmatimonadota bacterium]